MADHENKVYQIPEEKIGLVTFDKPWFLLHMSIEDEGYQLNHFFPSLEIGVKNVARLFEEEIISHWLKKGQEGIDKVNRLREFLLTTWNNPGVETMRKSLYETYNMKELKEKTGRDLIYDGYNFLALTIAHIALRFNKKHFYFEGLHLAAHVVNNFLSVDFWSGVKQEALNKLGNTVLK